MYKNGQLLFFKLFNGAKPLFKLQKRSLNCQGESAQMTGLVLGVYSDDGDVHGTEKYFTKSFEHYDEKVQHRLSNLLKRSGPVLRANEVRVFYDVDPKYSAVAVTGLGDECVSYNEFEEIDEWKEAIRVGAANGVQELQKRHMRVIAVESFEHAESAAEGAAMGIWVYQELKNESKQKIIPRLELYEDCDYTGWQIGLQKAAAQNLARQMSETPANMLTPIAFAQAAVEVLCKAGVSVEVKVRNWADITKMGAFLAAASGSCEHPIFLELSYYGCDPDTSPVVLVGKGVTFDSGSLCLKSCPSMKHMKGEMSGAAIVVAVSRAAAALQLPINIRGLIPLYESLPGSCSIKPGDIIRSQNGKSIMIDHTDYDGRLALADALSYGGAYNPRFILDVGTLSKEMQLLMGSGATGVFTNNPQLYENMRIAAMHTGDRVWPMPLWEHYTEKITSIVEADVVEPDNRIGGACSSAAFLQQFIPNTHWIHLDTYGVNYSSGNMISYLREGMSGRPTRTIIEFLAQLACMSHEDQVAEETPICG